MRLMIGQQPLRNLSFVQSKQAVAIMDGIARLIPQEGVDYDVQITFRGANDPSVSMDIVAHTDKGEWWKRYVAQMIRKYPPVVEYKGERLPESPSPSDFPDLGEEQKKTPEKECHEEDSKESPEVGH